MIDWLFVGTWFVIGLLVFGMMSTILMIGRPRDPITPRAALVIVIVGLIQLWVVWTLARADYLF